MSNSRFDRWEQEQMRQDDEFQKIFRQSRTFFWIVVALVVVFFAMIITMGVGVMVLAYRAWF
jgi:nitrogen fixation protein FixH